MNAVRQVGHVLVKDVREYRLWLGVYMLVIIAEIIVIAGAHQPGALGNGVIVAGAFVTAGIAIAAVAQADSPISSRAFWATRPLSPMSMLAAKAGVAVALVVVALVGQVAALVLLHVPGSRMPAVLAASAPAFLVWLAIATLAGALTQSVRVFVLVEVALGVVGIVGNAIGSELAWHALALGALVPISTVVEWCGLIGIAVATYSGRARQRRRWLAALAVLSFATSLGQELGAVGGDHARAVAINAEPPTPGLPQFTLALSPVRTAAADSMGRQGLGLLLSIRVAAIGGANAVYDSSLVETNTHYAPFHGYSRTVSSSWRDLRSPHDAVFDTVRATLQLDVATLTLGDGSTLAVPVSGRLIGLTDPDPAVMNDLRTGTASVNSGADVLLPIDASSRVVAGGGVRSVALDGRVYVFRPRLAGVLPLGRGAHVQHDANSVLIADWSYAEGVGHMILATKRLVSPTNKAAQTPDLDGSFAYYLIGDTTCAIWFRMGCVHGKRDFARPLDRESDGYDDSFILPGWSVDWGSTSYETYMRASDSTAHHGDEEWLRAVRLMVVAWMPQGSYAVHLRTAMQ